MELADNTRKNSKTNQPLFQKAVYEISANGRILPMKYFPSGRRYFEIMKEKDRKNVFVIHNNFIVGKNNKINRFKEFDLWIPDAYFSEF